MKYTSLLALMISLFAIPSLGYAQDAPSSTYTEIEIPAEASPAAPSAVASSEVTSKFEAVAPAPPPPVVHNYNHNTNVTRVETNRVVQAAPAVERRRRAEALLQRKAGGLYAGGKRIPSGPLGKKRWAGIWSGLHSAGVVSRSFVEARDAKTLADAKTYTDDKVGVALTEAKAYSDGGRWLSWLAIILAVIALIVAAIALARAIPRWRAVRPTYGP